MANAYRYAQSRFALHQQSSQYRAVAQAANGGNQLFGCNVETAPPCTGSKIMAATCFASMSDLTSVRWRRGSPVLKCRVNLTERYVIHRTRERAEADFVRRDLPVSAMVIYVRPWKPPLNAIRQGVRYGREQFSPRSQPLPRGSEERGFGLPAHRGKGVDFPARVT